MKRIHSSKKMALVGAAVIVVAAGGFGAYQQFHHVQNSGQKPGFKQYPPISKAEKAAADQEQVTIDQRNAARDKAAADAAANGSTASSKQAVTPVITTASQIDDQVTITAYTPGIYESGGSCTMKATKGSQVVTRTSQAFANATTTDCPPFLMHRSDFPTAGDWSVIISYNSDKAQGASNAKTLTLQ